MNNPLAAPLLFSLLSPRGLGILRWMHPRVGTLPGPGPSLRVVTGNWCGPSRDDAKQVDLSSFLRGVLDVRWPIALGPLIVVVELANRGKTLG